MLSVYPYISTEYERAAKQPDARKQHSVSLSYWPTLLITRIGGKKIINLVRQGGAVMQNSQ